LENKLKENKIRSDLYYRITRSIRIDIPPLRDHKSDLLPLFKHFFEKAWAWHNKTLIEIDQMVPELLSQYSWPGNVRELRNFAEDVARWLDKDCKRLDREKLLSLECLNKENLDIVLLCNEAKPFVGETFSKRHIKLFQYALGQQIEKFSISEYIRFCINHCRTKISKATALRDLKKLCEIGLIEPFGGGRTSGYRILPRQ
jgi:transcriptional regulator with PAS, ATPase and Fis domain